MLLYFLKKNWPLLIIVLLSLVVLVSIIIFNPAPRAPLEKISPTPSELSPSPTPQSLLPDESVRYKTSTEQIYITGQQIRDQDAAVASLIQQLPVAGADFSLSYSFSNNLFTATIKQSAKDQGSAELDQFLKSQGVERSWIRNLSIVYD